MSKDGWFLYVKQSRVTGEYYVHQKAKYHYFEGDRSFCGEYFMDTDYFETNVESGEVESRPEIACKKCFKKWKKEFIL